MSKYSKIIIDDAGNTHLDSVTYSEDEKIPVIIQRSALINKLAQLGSKKIALQRSIIDLTSEESNTSELLAKVDETLNS